jgi:CheY-like chemotaxis protein
MTLGELTLRWLGGATPNLSEARQAVERIIKDSYRASEVISRICTLVKKAPPRSDRVDLNEVIVEVFALAQSEARRNRVYLKRQLKNDLPPGTEEPDRLGRIPFWGVRLGRRVPEFAYVLQTDCLIADVRMPGMSGLELQERLNASSSPIPIVFISAHDDKEAQTWGLRAGAIAFLQKPFSADSLLGAISAGLDKT